MTDEFTFGIKSRLYNWNMRSKRLNKGLSQKGLGELVGCNISTIGHYESLRAFPLPERASKIAGILETSVEVLFPEWLREFKLKTVPTIQDERITLERARELRLFDPKALITDGNIESVDAAIDNELLSEQIRQVLHRLSPREREVLELRFGLVDDIPRTYEQVGSRLNVTRERIRQIEHVALKHLRHPSRSKHLRGFL